MEGETRATPFIQVVTTTANREDAQRVAAAALEQRLAACVQIAGPITSSYWWQGAIETAEEWWCVMKSRADLLPQLERAIRAVHPYDEPEILVTPVVAGSAGYLAWLDRELRPSR